MNIKRMRGRNHRPSGTGGSMIRHQSGNIPLNRNHVFDSSGPDLRVRGTAQQLFERYLQLGRDATVSGDRVAAEGYYQHAEHYFRITNAMIQAAQQNAQSAPQQGNGQNGNGNYQPRRSNSLEAELEEAEASHNGLGEQPEEPSPRDIPIGAAPPEA